MALAWLAMAFVVGVGAGTLAAAPPVICVLLACLSALLAWRRLAPVPLLCVAALLLGIARAPHGTPAPGHGDVSWYNGKTVRVTGVVVEEPDVRDTGVNFVVSVGQVEVGSRLARSTGTIEVHAPRSEAVDYGDAVALTGKLLAPRDSRAVPYADILARRGIFSTMRFPSVADDGPASTGMRGRLVSLRQWLERNISAWLPEPEASLLIAITLGARSASLGNLAPLLVSTGLIHIIAISGIKVAMIAGTLFAVARRLRAPRIALVVTLLALWWYVLLTGATVSGVRSAAMWTLLFVAVVLGRNTVSLVSLSVIVGLMVAAQPQLVWDSAFQLTAIGTAAIVAFSTPISQRVEVIPSPVREAFAVTLAAQLGTLPVVILGFHVVSLTGPIANALVLPLLPLLIALGFLIGVFGAIGTLAGPISAVSYGLLHATVVLVGWLGALPGAIPVDTVPAAAVAGYFAALTELARRSLRRHHWAPSGDVPHLGRDALLALIVGATLATAAVTHAQSSGPRLVRLGSGDAMLLRDGKGAVLIDGSSHPYELLERLSASLPYDEHDLASVVVTDPRAGNVAGLRAVLQHYRVGEVLDPGVQYPSRTYAGWRSDLRRLHIPVLALRTGTILLFGDVTLEAVAPDGLRYRPIDSVGMLRIWSRRTSVLVAGAASQLEQHEAVFRSVPLRADVLVNAATRCDTAFLRHIAAKHVYGQSCPHAVLPGPNKPVAVFR